MRYFLGACLVTLGLLGAAAGGRMTAATPHRGDTPAQRDAVAIVTANIAAAITYYDLEWDDPPHVLSVTTNKAGDSVVLEEVKVSTNSYSDSVNPVNMRFVLRGIVSPKNWLRGGKLKIVSSHRYVPRKGPKA